VESIGGQFYTTALGDIQTNMACIKNMAIRQVTHMLHGHHSKEQSFQLFETHYLKFEQRAASHKFSWFENYKKRMELRYMREVQDGSSAEALKRHVVAMQCPVASDSSLEMLQSERERLLAELGELQDAAAQRNAEEAAEEEPEMPHPLVQRPRMNPQHIRYSQDSILHKFRDRNRGADHA